MTTTTTTTATVTIAASIKRETAKALLLRDCTGNGGDAWFPKSLTQSVGTIGSIAGALPIFTVPVWLAHEKQFATIDC